MTKEVVSTAREPAAVAHPAHIKLETPIKHDQFEVAGADEAESRLAALTSPRNNCALCNEPHRHHEAEAFGCMHTLHLTCWEQHCELHPEALVEPCQPGASSSGNHTPAALCPVCKAWLGGAAPHVWLSLSGGQAWLSHLAKSLIKHVLAFVFQNRLCADSGRVASDQEVVQPDGSVVLTSEVVNRFEKDFAAAVKLYFRQGAGQVDVCGYKTHFFTFVDEFGLPSTRSTRLVMPIRSTAMQDTAL